MLIRSLALFLLTAIPGCGQNFVEATILPAYQRASVPHGQGPGLQLEGSTMKALLMRAYGVGNYQISGPAWMDQKRFNIEAKAAPGKVTPEEMNTMLRHLLEGKFQIAVHHQTKDFRGYSISVGPNGPRLKLAAASHSNSRIASSGNGQIRCVDCSLAFFTELLSRQADKPFVDATGLKGEYDISLIFQSVTKARNVPALVDTAPPPTPTYPRGIPDGNYVNVPPPPLPPPSPPDRITPGPPLPDALREQLGLKLERINVNVETLVIDHIQQMPR